MSVSNDVTRRVLNAAMLARVNKELAEEATREGAGMDIDSPGAAQLMRRVELHWRAFDAAVDTLLGLLIDGETPVLAGRIPGVSA